MSTPVALLSRRATEEDHPARGRGLDLAGLMGLLGTDLTATAEEAAASRALTAAELRTRVRGLSLRAAGWGAGPQGAWRAW